MPLIVAKKESVPSYYIRKPVCIVAFEKENLFKASYKAPLTRKARPK